MRNVILFAIWIIAATLSIFSAFRPPTTLGLGTGPTRTSWSEARTNIMLTEPTFDPMAYDRDPRTPRHKMEIGKRLEINNPDGNVYTYEVVDDGTRLKLIKVVRLADNSPVEFDPTREIRTNTIGEGPKPPEKFTGDRVDLGALLQEQLLILLTAGVLTIATRRPSLHTRE